MPRTSAPRVLQSTGSRQPPASCLGGSERLPDYAGLVVEFPGDLSTDAQEKACGIVCYWAKLPYVANGSSNNKWMSRRHFWINASSYDSTSANWRGHDVFELLYEMLRDGTPVRKDGTQRWTGLNLEPTRVVLNHNHMPPPTADAETLEQERGAKRDARERRARRQGRSAGGMLYFPRQRTT